MSAIDDENFKMYLYNFEYRYIISVIRRAICVMYVYTQCHVPIDHTSAP